MILYHGSQTFDLSFLYPKYMCEKNYNDMNSPVDYSHRSLIHWALIHNWYKVNNTDAAMKISNKSMFWAYKMFWMIHSRATHGKMSFIDISRIKKRTYMIQFSILNIKWNDVWWVECEKAVFQWCDAIWIQNNTLRQKTEASASDKSLELSNVSHLNLLFYIA